MTSFMGQFWWLTVVVLACAFNMAGQILWSRYLPRTGFYASLRAGFWIGLVPFVGLSWEWLDQPIGDHLANLTIYVCFEYVYFHWNNMGETGRRVRLAIELMAAPDGLTHHELLTQYGGDEVLTRRMRRMTEGGHVVLRNSRYYLNHRFLLWTSRMIRLTRAIVSRLLDLQS